MILEFGILGLFVIIAVLAIMWGNKYDKENEKRLNKFINELQVGLVLPCGKAQNDRCSYERLFYKVYGTNYSVNQHGYGYDLTLEVENQAIVDSQLVTTRYEVDVKDFMEYYLDKEVVNELIEKGNEQFAIDNPQHAKSWHLNETLGNKVCKFQYTRDFRPGDVHTCIASFQGSYLSYVFIGHPMEDGQCNAGGAGFDIIRDEYSYAPITQEEFELWQKTYAEFAKSVQESGKAPLLESNKLTRLEYIV